MGIIDPHQICQIALVVKDIEAAAKNYAEIFGVEVPEIWLLAPEEESHTKYRGLPTGTRAKLCVFELGSIILELTEPDEHPSSWKEFLEEKGEGVHHIGFMVKDREEALSALEKRGIPVRHTGEYPGGSYTFVDSEAQLGVLLNLKYEPKN
ncbi:VOC family protein [Paenibacillus woosongensis]|uniref:VOC family protein n=1 Tax=Paenibacillus woosongensis TaxID=307580 RepID=A0AA95I4R5_9BACL|nr:VOC family protein [Paenibacillus woosongensis]WHX49446.1 VOC family protein [Paenibacillus woosongensis]